MKPLYVFWKLEKNFLFLFFFLHHGLILILRGKKTDLFYQPNV